MQQHIIEKSRYDFISTMLLGNPDLLNLYSAEAPSLSGTNEDKNGVIIIHNNRIFITPPLPGGKPAVISAVHPIVLKIGQQTITAPTEVTSADYLTWEIYEKPQYQITLSEDKLKAYFTLYRAERYAWNLVNCPASADVTVRAELNRDMLLSTLSIEQVVASFEKSSLIGNLNIPALYTELNNPTYLPVCIAEGKAPVPGTDASLELLFPKDIEHKFFRSHSSDSLPPPESPTIREGAVFALKLPPKEGLPGFDVFGSILPPPPPQDITLSAGECAVLLPGGEIAALRKGRPRITGSGNLMKTIDFPTAYRVAASLDASAGILMFPGDVIVSGHLAEHTVIEALGNVYVYGDVCNSTITATGSILVTGRISGSGLYAGAFGVIHNRLCSSPKLLMQEITGLREAARLLAETVGSQQQSVKYGLVIMLLLESKYDHLPSLIKDLKEIIAGTNADYPQDTGPLEQMLEVFLHPGQFIEVISATTLDVFLKLLMDLSDGIALMQEENVRIDIVEAQGSIIKSGGDLHIHGDGVQQSKLFSSGHIYFASKDSACTDSIVEAAGTGVTVGEHSTEIDEPAENIVFTARSLRDRSQA